MYTLKSGILYQEPTKEELLKIKGSLCGPVKKIYRGESELLLITDICYPDPEKKHTGDVRSKEYTMKDPNGRLIGRARPGYAALDDPDVVGWPVCRMPKVDRADITIDGTDYLILMYDSRNYGMQNNEGKEILHIQHNGIAGGWTIKCDHDFAPEVLCGLFVFCRYIEQENEFLIV